MYKGYRLTECSPGAAYNHLHPGPGRDAGLRGQAGGHGAVEPVLDRHAAIREVAVYGVSDALQGEAVKAAIVLKQGATGKILKRVLREETWR